MKRLKNPKKKKNLRQPSVLRFKHRIPTKLGWTARWHDLAVRSALEENGLGSRSSAVCKSAKRPCSARRKAVQHAVKTWGVRARVIISHVRWECGIIKMRVLCSGIFVRRQRTLVSQLAQKEFNVWAWKTVHCRETQRRVLSNDWAPDLDSMDQKQEFKIRKKKKRERERCRKKAVHEWGGMMTYDRHRPAQRRACIFL